MAECLSQSQAAGKDQDLNPGLPNSVAEFFHPMKDPTKGQGSVARVITKGIFTLEGRLSTPLVAMITVTRILYTLFLYSSQ